MKKKPEPNYIAWHFAAEQRDVDDNQRAGRSFFTVRGELLLELDEVLAGIWLDGVVISRRVPKAGELVDRDVKPAKPGKDSEPGVPAGGKAA